MTGNMFTRDRPEVFLVVKDLGILHVVCAVHARLKRQHGLGVADVASQFLRHLIHRLEDPRKYFRVGLYDGVFCVAYVDLYRSVIGVDSRLDGVADVIPHLRAGLRVRETVRRGVSIQYPDEAAFGGYHQVRITIKLDKGHDMGDPFRDLPVVHDAAVAR